MIFQVKVAKVAKRHCGVEANGKKKGLERHTVNKQNPLVRKTLSTVCKEPAIPAAEVRTHSTLFRLPRVVPLGWRGR